MKIFRILGAAVIAAATLSACSDPNNDKAQQLLDEAQKEYDNAAYEKVLSLVDSLRRTYPEAIKEREKALQFFQDASEKLAQKQIAQTDGMLQKASAEWQELFITVEEHKKKGIATAEELSKLTNLKLLKDSLQARFDTQCATVRFIREKRKEN